MGLKNIAITAGVAVAAVVLVFAFVPPVRNFALGVKAAA